MGKGRFLNQKLGKRTSRKLDLLKSRLTARRTLQISSSPRRGRRGKKDPNPASPQAVAVAI